MLPAPDRPHAALPPYSATLHPTEPSFSLQPATLLYSAFLLPYSPYRTAYRPRVFFLSSVKVRNKLEFCGATLRPGRAFAPQFLSLLLSADWSMDADLCSPTYLINLVGRLTGQWMPTFAPQYHSLIFAAGRPIRELARRPFLRRNFGEQTWTSIGPHNPVCGPDPMEAYLCSPKFLFRNGRRASSSIRTEWGEVFTGCHMSEGSGTIYGMS